MNGDRMLKDHERRLLRLEGKEKENKFQPGTLWVWPEDDNGPELYCRIGADGRLEAYDEDSEGQGAWSVEDESLGWMIKYLTPRARQPFDDPAPCGFKVGDEVVVTHAHAHLPVGETGTIELVELSPYHEHWHLYLNTGMIADAPDCELLPPKPKPELVPGWYKVSKWVQPKDAWCRKEYVRAFEIVEIDFRGMARGEPMPAGKGKWWFISELEPYAWET